MISDATGEDATRDSAKRRQILEGARSVFRQSGYDGASMGEVARVAGVSKGTLYVYFDSKEALFEALTVSERRDVAEVLFRLDDDDSDVAGVLSRVGDTLLEMLIRPEHVMTVRMVIGASEKMGHLARAYYESGPGWGAQRLGEYLGRQAAAGSLHLDDPVFAAEQFLNLCSSGILKRLLFGVDIRVDKGVRSRTVRSAVDMFMARYGVPSSRKAAETRA